MKKIEKLFGCLFTYIMFWLFYFLYIYIFKIRNKTKIIGRENIPKVNHGLLSWKNHESFLDPLPDRAVRMNFWRMIFHQNRIPYDTPDFKNFFGNKVKAFFFRNLRNLPIKRKTEDERVREEFVNKCCDLLKNYNLNIYFEGGRTIDEIRPCTTGFAKIILRSIEQNLDVIFLPMYSSGLKDIMPFKIGMNYLKMSFGHRVLMVIGKPVSFSDIVETEIPREKKIYLIKKRVRDSVLALKP